MGLVLSLPARLWRWLTRRTVVPVVGNEKSTPSPDKACSTAAAGHLDSSGHGDHRGHGSVHRTSTEPPQPIGVPELQIDAHQAAVDTVDDASSDASVDSAANEVAGATDAGRICSAQIRWMENNATTEASDRQSIHTSDSRRQDRPHPLVPPTLIDLFDRFGLEEGVLENLDISELTKLSSVCRRFQRMVKDYILEKIISKTTIQLHTRYIEEGQRQEREFVQMIPVIRRIQKSRRFLPFDRVVYEPEPSFATNYRYRLGQFSPDCITIYTPYDDCRPLRWQLGDHWEWKRNDRRRRSRCYIRDPDETFRALCYKFEDDFKDSRPSSVKFPVNVFYSRKGEAFARLHILSIPFNILVERLSVGVSPNRNHPSPNSLHFAQV